MLTWEELKQIVLPPGKLYVEIFGARLFWVKRRPHPIEVVNDIDGSIVKVFRAMRNWPEFESMVNGVMRHPKPNELNEAWRTYRMYVDRILASERERFRLFFDRFTRAQIDRCDEVRAVTYWDSDETVFFVDPPDSADLDALKAALSAIKGAGVLVAEAFEAPGWRRDTVGQKTIWVKENQKVNQLDIT